MKDLRSKINSVIDSCTYDLQDSICKFYEVHSDDVMENFIHIIPQDIYLKIRSTSRNTVVYILV